METSSDLGSELTAGELPLNLTLDFEHAHVSGDPMHCARSFVASDAAPRSHPRRRDHLRGCGIRLVLGCSLNLMPVESQTPLVVALLGLKLEQVPIDRDFAAPHPEKPAEIDHRGPRLAIAIDD